MVHFAFCLGILLECTHADMKKQHTRHDAMMRMLIKEFTKGSKGSHYLIARYSGHTQGYWSAQQADSQVCTARCHNSQHLTCRVGDARKTVRPDMMIVEMMIQSNTHTLDTGSRLPNLQRTMPNGKARKVTIVEGGYCSDVSYLEKVKEKGQQHAKPADTEAT